MQRKVSYSRHVASHNFKGQRNLGGGKNTFGSSCLCYNAYRKMIPVKVMFVEFC